MALTGERLTSVTRRLRTPTATEWRNGRMLDAGLAHILSHNVAHAQLQSLRQWVFSLGPGAVTNLERGYGGLEDRPDPGSYGGLSTIAWDVRTAQRFGPFLAIRDREATARATAFRRVRVDVDCEATALTLLAALTVPGELPDGGALAFVTASVTAGRGIVTLDLDPTPALLSDLWPSRLLDGDSPERASVFPLDLWLGWYSTTGSSSIYTICAHEVR